MNYSAITAGLLFLIPIPMFSYLSYWAPLVMVPLLFFGLFIIFLGLLLPGRKFRPGYPKLEGSPFKNPALRDLYTRQRRMVLRTCLILSAVWCFFIVFFVISAINRTGQDWIITSNPTLLFPTLVLIPVATGLLYLALVLRSLHVGVPSSMPESLINDFFAAFSFAFIVYICVVIAGWWPFGMLFYYMSGIIWLSSRYSYPTELLTYWRLLSKDHYPPSSFIETEEMVIAEAKGILAKSGLVLLLFWPLLGLALAPLLPLGVYEGIAIAILLLGILLIRTGYRRIFPRFVLAPFTPEVVEIRKRNRRTALVIVLALFIIWDLFLLLFMFMPGLHSSAISLVWLLNALSLFPIGGALLYFGLFLRSVHTVMYPNVKLELLRNLVLAFSLCLIFFALIYVMDQWAGGFLFLSYAVFFWLVAQGSYPKTDKKAAHSGSI